MFIAGLVIGGGLGLLLSVFVSEQLYGGIQRDIKALEREIAADNLECAKEERRAAALRLILQNEQQARENER
jgi:hypothetical protein